MNTLRKRVDNGRHKRLSCRRIVSKRSQEISGLASRKRLQRHSQPADAAGKVRQILAGMKFGIEKTLLLGALDFRFGNRVLQRESPMHRPLRFPSPDLDYSIPVQSQIMTTKRPYESFA